MWEGGERRGRGKGSGRMRRMVEAQEAQEAYLLELFDVNI